MTRHFFISELDLETGNALMWSNLVFQEEGNAYPGTSTLYIRHRVLNALAVFDALGRALQKNGF